VSATVSAEVAEAALDSARLDMRGIGRDASSGAPRRAATSLTPTVPCTALPRSLFDSTTEWIVRKKGRWIKGEHISILEARTLLMGLYARASDLDGHDMVSLSLQDNACVSYAVTKGRSASFTINTVLRKVAAVSLARNLRLIAPWVSTHDQPADEASRDEEDDDAVLYDATASWA